MLLTFNVQSKLHRALPHPLQVLLSFSSDALYCPTSRSNQDWLWGEPQYHNIASLINVMVLITDLQPDSSSCKTGSWRFLMNHLPFLPTPLSPVANATVGLLSLVNNQLHVNRVLLRLGISDLAVAENDTHAIGSSITSALTQATTTHNHQIPLHMSHR